MELTKRPLAYTPLSKVSPSLSKRIHPGTLEKGQLDVSPEARPVPSPNPEAPRAGNSRGSAPPIDVEPVRASGYATSTHSPGSTATASTPSAYGAIGAHAGVVVKLGDERQHQDRVDSRRDRERRALHVAEADALALVRARARVR